jgi:uncharacterized coiled-coil protein SlyX
MTIRERFEALQRHVLEWAKHSWHSYAGDSTLIPNDSGEWVRRDDMLALADALDAEAGSPNNPCTGAEFVAVMQADKARIAELESGLAHEKRTTECFANAGNECAIEHEQKIADLNAKLATVERHVRDAYGINQHSPMAGRLIGSELRGAIAAIEGNEKP